MTDNTKPIPKSLHTVTVLVKLARLIRATSATPVAADAAISEALDALGYDADTPDTHGLAAAALNALRASK